MKKILLRFFLGLITYLLIFNPIPAFLNGMGSVKLLYPLLLMLLFKKYQYGLKYISHVLVAMTFYVLYLTTYFLWGGDNLIYPAIIAYIEAVFLSYIIIMMHINSKVNLFSTLLWCSIFAAFSSLLALLSSPINNFIRTQISVPLLETATGASFSFRSFGIGSELTFCYSIVLAIVLTMGLYYKKEGKLLLYLIPVFFIAIIINARVGVIPLVMGLAFVFLYNRNRISTHQISMLVAILFAIYVLTQFNWSGVNSVAYEHSMEFFYEMSDILTGSHLTQSNTMEGVYHSHVSMPNNVSEWMWGRGVWVYNLYGWDHSDSGWINQLNYGGILGILIVWSLVLVHFKVIKNKGDRKFLYYILATLIIANLKGPVLPSGTTFIVVNMILMHLSIKNILERGNAAKLKINSVLI